MAMNDIQAQYEEMETRRNAAFAMFSSIYDNEHPEPERGQPTDVGKISLFFQILIMAASIYVSGSRTITEFGGGFLGFCAFVMLEGAIIYYSFFRTRSNFNEAQKRETRKQSGRGLALAFIVALAANIHSVLTAHGIAISPTVGTVINLFVALSAPVMAFIGGDLFSYEQLRIQSRYKAVDMAYESALNAWQDTKSKAWNSQQTRYGANIKIAVPEPSQIVSGETVSETGRGIPISVGQTVGQRLETWLSQHPEGWDMSVSEVSQVTGLPRSSVGREMKKLRSGGG